MASFTVDVAPTVLIWARHSAGLSVETVAKRMDLSSVDIRAWEEGAEDPAFAKLTFARLKELARIYRRPVTVFYLDSPPTDFLVPTDYRRISGAGPEPPSTQLRFELRRLAAEREAAIELALLSQEMPARIEFSINLDDEPDEAGLRIRSWLGIELQDQDRWAGRAFRFWTQSVEAKGILVAQLQGVPIEELRGCSFSEQPFPLLAVNQQDAMGGRLFTLLHEVGHFLLDEGGLCDLHENPSRQHPALDRVERFCNSVAASALMPRLSVLEELGKQSFRGRLTDEILRDVASRYGVSQEAALLRLVTLGLASRQEYERRRQLFLRFARDARESRKEKRSKVRVLVARKRLDGFGRRFVEEAVNAYERQDITASDLADYLDMKLDHLPRLTELLRDQA